MKKTKIMIITLIILISFVGCNEDVVNEQEQKRPTIAVSIVPQKTFVKAVGGDLVNVVTMIPPGNSPANYQPTPNEIKDFSDASLYFSIGVPTEKANILPKIKDLNKNLKVIALEEKVSKKYPDRYIEGEGTSEDHDDDHDHDHKGRDPHIWLSPKRVQVMIEVIRDELIKLDSDNRATYEKNANEYIDKLKGVDQEIKGTLKGVKKKTIIAYHPSFGYFADDYGLNMLVIEDEGKEATAKRLKDIINIAKTNNIKFVFYQAEFDDSQAKIIANEINGETVKLDPLASDYINNLKNIAEKFKEVGKGKE